MRANRENVLAPGFWRFLALLLSAFTPDLRQRLAVESCIQLQQRNCLRISRNSFRRFTDLLLAKNCRDLSVAPDRWASRKWRGFFWELIEPVSSLRFSFMPALFLLLALVIYRVVATTFGHGDLAWLMNFAPVAAVALCGALFLPRTIAIALPLVALGISDLLLNLFHYHAPFFTWEIVPRYFAIALIIGLGFALRGRAGATSVFMASVAGSVLFYLITNTASWIGDPGYVKTFAGWLQAMTTGLPGYSPTWWFYRQTLLSDIAFTALCLLCNAFARRRSASGAIFLRPAGNR
jgi:hypothetical protein